MFKVEQVPCIKQWLRTFREGDVRVGFITEDHFRTLHTKASQVNAEWRDGGYGRYIHHVTNAEGCRACVVCISDDERENELKDINHANDWKEKIPRFFYCKDVWEVGSKHD